MRDSWLQCNWIRTLTIYRDNNEAVNAFLEKRKATYTATIRDDAPVVYPWFTRVNTKNQAVPEPAAAGKSKL